MPTLLTPRLALSQITEADWPLFRYLQQQPEVMRYVADNRPETEIRQAFDARLPDWQPGSRHWLCMVMRHRKTGVPIGVTGFILREDDIAEVGFLLDPSFHGQGYGYESLYEVCAFAFAEVGIRKLVATVTAGNFPSKKVLEKVGFQPEGTLRENYWLNERWQDDWIFGLLAREFR
ncbi:GNAT family N-acetyltransferase [Enterobacter sp. Ap-916]|uniref:GNAT family N-acetyltransferase n=1 Tax=unclassified Enterobacter TaxID=2608935 RepID=UPI00142218A2|nr:MULTISPECIES: GNAT family protein [unclassified Enterobacter]NIF59793.1 GNAT family N-acetyltransferase [Enterobacter sp. Ap-867]NIG31235.1 GNAT family N-acetyltransferase [Enterobacter sp. Ap-916]